MISTALYLLLVLFALAQLASSAELLESTAEVATCPRGSRCRCLPFDHCWPGSDKWHSLNDTVDGRLIANVPLGSPCHDPSYDQEACDELSRTWTLPQTHLNSSSSVMQGFFANNSCSPFMSRSAACRLGNLVSYSVNVSTPDHVVRTINFARQNNIRLVVRNTAHDYLGRSTGAGGLAVWMLHMKEMRMTSYETSNYSWPALWASAGVLGAEAIAFAASRNLTIIAGDCPTVGLAGGFTQGGGHSPLSTTFGLAADQVLEYEVVTADGRKDTASQRKNADLYWALSGGGGGTFAIVTALTVRAHPNAPVGGAALTVSRKGTTRDKFEDFVARFHAAVPRMIDLGASMSWLQTTTLLRISPVTVYGADAEYVKTAIMAPLIDALRELAIPAFIDTTTLPFSDHYAHYMGPMPYGHLVVESFQFGGRLIPRHLLQHQPDAYDRVVRNLTSHGLLLLGSAASFRAPWGVENAVPPALRQASVVLQLAAPWNVSRRDRMVDQRRRMTDEYVRQVEAITPGGGAYMNEADLGQRKWQETFYGPNYPALLEIKKRWDPNGLLYGLKTVGSEDWHVASDGRMCKM